MTDLTLTAIAIKQGETAVIFISASLGAVSNELSDEIRHEATLETGVTF